MDQLPMSLANIPGQGDTRVPMGLNPPANVDTIGQVGRAYSLADAADKHDQRQQDLADRRLVQEALQNGANMQTPDGLKDLAESLKGKVQPGTYQGLIKAQGTLAEEAAKVEERLAQTDEKKLKTMQMQGEVVLKSVSGLLDEYDSTVKEKGLDVAMNEFGAKKDATLKALQESGMVPAPIIQQMARMSPVQLKSMQESSKYWQDKLKAAADVQERTARANKEQAAADSISAGGKDMATLQALEEKYGPDSEEVKNFKDKALKNKPGAGSGVQPTMTDDAVNLAAERLLKGDKTALQNIGRGVQGAANITAINNRVAALAKDRGIDANKVLQAQSELGAAQKGLKDLAGRSAKIDAAVIEVDKFADNALEALDKVKRGDTVPLNEIMRRVELGTGSPEEAAFATYVKSLAGAYANVLGRGTTTVFSQTEADKIIRKDYSAPQFKAMVEAIKKEARAVQDSSKGAGENIKREVFKVSPADQKERDKDAPLILNGELKKAQEKLAAAKDPDEKERAENDLVGIKREMKRLGIAIPDAGAAPGKKDPKKDVPPKNEKGWTLHEDAKGNKAYMSPDGKQWEEVK